MMGQRLAHYELLEVLGEGATGVVYRARDLHLDRLVALKLIAPAGSRATRAGLAREARAASALNHPNILTIFELEPEGDRPFIAMELVEGPDLRRRIAAGPLEPHVAVPIAIQIARGLGAAHQRGIVHRDLKPANVLIGSDGTVKVGDFGLAHGTGIDATMSSGGWLGTPHYMAPEQAQDRAPDPRSDIFSLGAVLYEMLSGERAFPGDTALGVLYAIVNETPRSLDDPAFAVPGALARVVARCLEKDPRARFGSMAEVIRALEAASEEQPAAGRTERAALGTASVRGEFVGRRPQLEVVLAALASVRAGRGGTIVVRGESGVGKTRLVAEAAERARRMGFDVFSGRCFDRDASSPYQAYASALIAGLRGVGEPVLRARAAASGIDLAPRLEGLRGLLERGDPSPGLAGREQLWGTVLQLLRVLAADRPVLLWIDDLHWAGASTLGLFSYLARNSGEVRMLQLATMRAVGSDAPEAADEALRDLRIEGAIETVDLARLEAEEESSLLGRLLPDGALDHELDMRLRALAQGHPLFLVELVKLVRSQGLIRLEEGTWRLADQTQRLPIPERVHDVIVRRLERVERSDRELLEAAACVGAGFDSEVLPELLGRSRVEVLRALQRLEREHGLLRHEDRRYRFDHPLIHQLVIESLLPELRQEIHREIADRLEARASGDESAAALAHHRLEAGEPDRALDPLLRAAERARRLQAGEEALALFERAASALDADEVSTRAMEIRGGLGEVLLRLGRPMDAEGHLERMRELARALGDARGFAEALRRQAELLRATGRAEEAMARCREALAMVTGPGDGRERAGILNTFAAALANRGAFSEAATRADEALALARGTGDRLAEAASLTASGIARFHLGDFEAAGERLETALAVQRSLGDLAGVSATLTQLGPIYHRRGDSGRAIAAMREAVDVKARIGDRRSLPGTLNFLGDIHRDLFDIERALTLHQRALDLARGQRNRGAECDNLRDLGADHLAGGGRGEAGRRLREALDLARAIGHTWYEARSCAALAELALDADRADEAADWSSRALERARTLAAREPTAEALWVRSRALDRTGSAEEGRVMLEDAIARTRELGHLPLLWRMLLDRASRSEDERAAAARREARAIVERIVSGLEDADARDRLLTAAPVRDLLVPAGGRQRPLSLP